MEIAVATAFSHHSPVDYIAGAAQRLEAAGFAAVWVPEHVLFFPDYAPVLSDIEQAELELATTEDAILFVPVSFDPESRQIFLNLLGPFVVNARTRKGRQLVLTGTSYTTRTPIELPEG